MLLLIRYLSKKAAALANRLQQLHLPDTAGDPPENGGCKTEKITPPKIDISITYATVLSQYESGIVS